MMFSALICSVRPLLLTSLGLAATTLFASPKLIVDEPVHDFGTVKRGDPLQFTFKIYNTGDEPLAITEVVPSCGCTTTGDWTHTIKPGEFGTIPVKIDTAEFIGNVIKSVTLKSNDPTAPETVLHMQASVWAPIKLSSSVVVFPGTANPDESATRSITIDNQTDDALTLSDLTSDNPHFKPELITLKPGKQFELKVTTVPPLGEGTQTGRIQFKSSNSKMPELSVQTVVTLLPPVQIAPAQIPLPQRQMTSPEKRFAIISVHRGDVLQVTDVETTAPGVEITSTKVAGGKQVTLTLTFPAGFEIKPSDKYVLRGKTNQPTAPTFEIPILAAGM